MKLEEQGASEHCGILPGQPYVRGIQSDRQKQRRERESEGGQLEGEGEVTLELRREILFMRRDIKEDESFGCLVPGALS